MASSCNLLISSSTLSDRISLLEGAVSAHPLHFTDEEKEAKIGQAHDPWSCNVLMLLSSSLKLCRFSIVGKFLFSNYKLLTVKNFSLAWTSKVQLLWWKYNYTKEYQKVQVFPHFRK